MDNNEFPFDKNYPQFTLVRQISPEQAHEVAMVAARLIQPSVMDDCTHKEAAVMVVEAYLQAYEAVEGWTRPLPPMADDKRTPDEWAAAAAVLEPYKGTIGTCGFYAAKAKAAHDGK